MYGFFTVSTCTDKRRDISSRAYFLSFFLYTPLFLIDGCFSSSMIRVNFWPSVNFAVSFAVSAIGWKMTITKHCGSAIVIGRFIKPSTQVARVVLHVKFAEQLVCEFVAKSSKCKLQMGCYTCNLWCNLCRHGIATQVARKIACVTPDLQLAL